MSANRIFAILLMTAGAVGAQTVITLERGMCFGTCPVYTVSLYDTGKVVFEGKLHVKYKGTQTAAIERAKVKALAAELERAGFFSFQDSYTHRRVTDMPTVVTTVRMGRRVKRIQHYLGDANAPKMLRVLERRIDAVAGSQQWIGAGKAPAAAKSPDAPLR